MQPHNIPCVAPIGFNECNLSRLIGLGLGFLLAEELPLYEVTNNVVHSNMRFLDNLCVGMRNCNCLVGRVLKRAALTREDHGLQPKFPCSYHRTHDVPRCAARTDSNQHVSVKAKSLHLPGEKIVEPNVVAERSDVRRVGRKSNCRKRRANESLREPASEFGSPVLALGSAAPVAAQEQLVTTTKGGAERLNYAQDATPAAAFQSRHNFYVFAKVIRQPRQLPIVF